MLARVPFARHPSGLSIDRVSPPSRYAFIEPGRWVLVFVLATDDSLLPSIAPWGAMGEDKAQHPFECFVEPMGGLILYLIERVWLFCDDVHLMISKCGARLGRGLWSD
jgi:hypothetical protein